MNPLRRIILSLTAIAGLGLSAWVSAQVCDVDANGVIDSNDITLIFSATNTPATGPDDPRDADGDGLITVNDASQCVLQCTLPNCEVVSANAPPTANAGPDQTALVGDTITLDGSGSSDPDGDALSYSWSIVSRPAGSSASLSDPSAVNPDIVIDVFGTYEVQLVVNDGTVDSAADTVVIATENSAPVANAGTDKTTYVGNLVTLDGSASSDVDGDSLTYSWTILARPSGSIVALSDPNAVNPTFIVDLAGSYEIGLTVNDGTVDSTLDTVVITTLNSPPVANAGPDQTALVNDVVTLDGSGLS